MIGKIVVMELTRTDDVNDVINVIIRTDERPSVFACQNLLTRFFAPREAPRKKMNLYFNQP